MAFSDAQQSQLSMHQTKKFAQDAKIPMLINIKDGRLLPNSLNIRANPDYRPYTGSLKATLSERMAFVSSATGRPRTRVTDTSSDDAPKVFDLGAASKSEIIAFALDEFSLVLDDRTDIRTMRKQVLAASESANSVGPSDSSLS